MKKNAVPELNYKWWNKNKSSTMKKSGLGKALTAYETAADQMDWSKALKALSEVKKKVVVAIDACNKTLHADTIAALKKYPKVIQGAESDLKTRQVAEQAKAAAATANPPAPKQKIGKDVVIWKRDIGGEAFNKCKPSHVSGIKGYTLQLKLNDDILDVLEAEQDYVTPAFMVEDAEKVGQKMISEIVDQLKKFDADWDKLGSAADPAKMEKLIKTQMLKTMSKYKALLEQIPVARWKKFAARNKQYRDYKIKTGLDISIGVLSTTVGAIGVAGAVTTGGASLVLGIVGVVRGVADIAKKIQDVSRDAEKVEKVLAGDLETLAKRYKNAAGEVKKSTQGGAEVGATVLKSILGADTPFLATLPKCQSNYALWDNKVAGLTVAGRKMSGLIVKGLAACDKLEKVLKGSKDDEVVKIYRKLQKARKALDQSLNSCSTMMGRVSKTEDNMPKLKKTLDALSVANPKYADIFERVFPAVVSLTLSGAGAGVGFEGAKTTLEAVNTSLSLFNDIAKEGKAQLEATIG
ncbi:MAG: hypothetical protein ACI92Z_002754 [Paracoccaceae bacterium]|jgi:hypothetical protein